MRSRLTTPKCLQNLECGRTLMTGLLIVGVGAYAMAAPVGYRESMPFRWRSTTRYGSLAAGAGERDAGGIHDGGYRNAAGCDVRRSNGGSTGGAWVVLYEHRRAIPTTGPFCGHPHDWPGQRSSLWQVPPVVPGMICSQLWGHVVPTRNGPQPAHSHNARSASPFGEKRKPLSFQAVLRSRRAPRGHSRRAGWLRQRQL